MEKTEQQKPSVVVAYDNMAIRADRIFFIGKYDGQMNSNTHKPDLYLKVIIDGTHEVVTINFANDDKRRDDVFKALVDVMKKTH